MTAKEEVIEILNRMRFRQHWIEMGMKP